MILLKESKNPLKGTTNPPTKTPEVFFLQNILHPHQNPCVDVGVGGSF